jgi:hypothetical protein
MRSLRLRSTLLLAALACAPAAGLAETSAPRMAARNPYLADSIYPIAHADSAQQDAVPIAGPRGTTRALGPDEIRYVHLGPAHFGALISGPYAGGRRVIWSNGLDRIVKLDHDSFRILATYFIPGATEYDEEEADAAIAGFDASNHGFFAFLRALRTGAMLRDISAVYTLLDRDNRLYVGDKHGTITAFRDAVPGDPSSAIEQAAVFRLPETAKGLLAGMNMTYDGWLVVVTEMGDVVAVSRDFQQSRSVRLLHAEEALDEKNTRPGYGWVRNSIAIDEAGGIYVASRRHMHKVVWTGERLSTDEADGAWSAEYLDGTGNGTGATPSLMGFGDEDRFVVITDGEPLMNMTLFWRDAIPPGWEPPPGAPSRRIAGMRPANLGDPSLKAIQTEQSVVVAGYGALVVNNEPRNVPWYVPERARALMISYLGSNPEYQPFGVQKFAWNPRERRLEEAWVNREVSSPNCVPLVGAGSGAVYLVGARDNLWTLEALDWETGASRFHWIVGGQRFNSLFAGMLLDQAGRPMWGTPWGKVRLEAGEGGGATAAR